jgi:hypothetical protein
MDITSIIEDYLDIGGEINKKVSRKTRPDTAAIIRKLWTSL